MRSITGIEQQHQAQQRGSYIESETAPTDTAVEEMGDTTSQALSSSADLLL